MNISVAFRINHLVNSIFLLSLVTLLVPENPFYFLGLGIWMTLTLLDSLLVLYKPTRLLCTRVAANKYIIHRQFGRTSVIEDAQIKISQLFSMYRLTIENAAESYSFYFWAKPKFSFDYSPCKSDTFLKLFNEPQIKR